MLNNKYGKKRLLTWLTFILLLLGISIGYALISSNLNIGGTSSINNPTWDVHWENVQVTSGSVSANRPTIDSNRTTVSYSVTLNTPGDYYEFTVDAVNAGTIDAMITSIDSKMNGTTITNLPAYLEYSVIYSDGTDLQVNQDLKHGTTEKYKVRVGYKKDINPSDLPSTDQTLDFDFSIEYEQADDDSEAVDHERMVYTINEYSNSIGNDESGDYIENDTISLIRFEKPIPNSVIKYNSSADVMAANLNRVAYLKHLIKNDIVKESYVEFVITPSMVSSHPEMTAGTYSLRGINTYDDNSESTYYCKNDYYNRNTGFCMSPYYERDKQSLTTAFGINNCNEYIYEPSDDAEYGCYGTKEYTCQTDGKTAIINSEGYASFDDNSWTCSVCYQGDCIGGASCMNY